MKLKNVKVGTRVELKVDHRIEPKSLPAGTTGTILQDYDDQPYVRWDVAPNSGVFHDAPECDQDYRNHSVSIECIRRIKE